MGAKPSIDIRKTEESGPDTEKYGDGSYFTHYLGNDENKTNSEINENKDSNERVGKVAEGNLRRKKNREKESQKRGNS